VESAVIASHPMPRYVPSHIMQRMIAAFIVALLACFVPRADAVPPADAVTPITEFESALRTHLAAIETKDFDSLVETITESDTLTLIFPDGERWDTRKQYVDFHRGWFKETNWHMTFKIERLIERGEMGTAFVRYTYDATDADGKTKHSDTWLTLVFVKEKNGWRLVFDQNTKIAAANPPPAP
jgi:ketosteroid isomerase-like protein